MHTFLELVANDVYQKFGNELSDTVVVFPNRRARLFFSDFLSKAAQKPIWSPVFLTISELIQQSTLLRKADSLQLISELYSVYQAETGSDESFDDFYFWGELLMNDFDDVDKNLVDAQQLFRNLQEIKEFRDRFEYLTDEQIASIQLFWQHFNPEKQTELKQRFIQLWSVLNPLYQGLQNRLLSQNLAWEGMMYRQVVELETDALLQSFSHKRYIFVGFNVLNRCETLLFKKLQNAGKAFFYWDYDSYYINSLHHEAGTFMRDNLAQFPSQLPAQLFNSFLSHPKKITLISASSENVQARYIHRWINDLQADNQPIDNRTAVVLANEMLLLPALHSIPEQISEINITMGFPLSQTPVYSFINALAALQTVGYTPSGRYRHKQIHAVLLHPFCVLLSDQTRALQLELATNNRFFPAPAELHKDAVLTRLFTPVNDTLGLASYLLEVLQLLAAYYRTQPNLQLFDGLYRESAYQAYTTLNRLQGLIESGKLELKPQTFMRLLQKMLSAVTIPFHGEPVTGMQIMGVLETRNLDFKNVLMLSVNEGLMPKSGNEASFIPFNLRKGFGMTTIEHKNALYAYYFYRLLQRADNVTFMYNTATDGMNKGERSRFLLQLIMESGLPVEQRELGARSVVAQPAVISIPKTDAILQTLTSRYDTRQNPEAYFSPSALNTYIDCSLRFYFRYVVGLKVPDEVSDQIDAPYFGSIFHKAAENVYRKIGKSAIEEVDIQPYLNDKKLIAQQVDAAFNTEFFRQPFDRTPDYNGMHLITRNVLVDYVHRLLTFDAAYAPFSMEAIEEDYYFERAVSTARGTINVKIGGRVDRIDRKDLTLRIVDYKTGGDAKDVKSISTLFTSDPKRASYSFQAFLYGSILSKQHPEWAIEPALFFIHKASEADYSAQIKLGEGKLKQPVTDFKEFETEFDNRLSELISGMFNANEPFCQTPHTDLCAWCDFKSICRR